MRVREGRGRASSAWGKPGAAPHRIVPLPATRSSLLPHVPTVLVSPGSSIGCACLLAMAALCANGTCDEDEATRVATAVRRVRQSPGLPVALRHAALAAALQIAAAQRGMAAALQLALAGVEGCSGLQRPSASTPAFLLEEALQLVAASASAAAPSSAAAAAFADQADGQDGEASGGSGVPVPLPLLQQLAALLNAGHDCRLRHLAFVLLQQLASQPPTIYRPPAQEPEDAAALLAGLGPTGQAVSAGGTHRTGGQSGMAAAPKIRLQLGGGGAAGGSARSHAISGGEF